MPVTVEINHSEKVSVNINSGTLSCIDLLVDNGYYSNRSDFINQAVRDLVRSHQSTLDRIIDMKTKENKPTLIGGSKNFGITAAKRRVGEAGEAGCEENSWFFGISGLSPVELATLSMEGKKVNISGYGVFTIDEGCPEELLFEVVKSINVRGKVLCSDTVREHYGLKK